MTTSRRSWWTRCSPSRTGASSSTVDRKSTRLNSSHGYISYAVFCLKKKKKSLNYSHGYISYAVFCLKKKTKSVHIKSRTIWNADPSDYHNADQMIVVCGLNNATND